MTYFYGSAPQPHIQNGTASVAEILNGSAGTAASKSLTANERAFMNQLRATGALSQQLTLCMPRPLVERLRGYSGHLEEITRVSGAQVDVAESGDATKLLLTFTGARVATSLAVLYLQEKMLQLGARG